MLCQVKKRSLALRGTKARQLVLSYIKCMDEMNQIVYHFGELVEEFERILENFRRKIKLVQSVPVGADAEDDSVLQHLIATYEDALSEFRVHISELTKLIQELKSSLDVVGFE